MMNRLKLLLMGLIVGMCTIVVCHAQNNEKNGKWPLPKTFVSPQPNKIDYYERLAPFYEKLNAYERAVANGNDSLPKLKVMMIGDSHVRGNILPRQLRDGLLKVWDIDFKYYCKNGVMLNYFLKPEQMDTILAYKPDLLIVAVGTNEAHSNFDAAKYTARMRDFVCQVLEGTDSATTILFTTPPGSHKKTTSKGKGKKTTSSLRPNDTNKVVADCQNEFCKKNGFAIWNILEIAGGINAPSNWRGAGLMQKDGIHYTVEAYRLQGNMLAWALIDTRNKVPRISKKKGNK